MVNGQEVSCIVQPRTAVYAAAARSSEHSLLLSSARRIASLHETMQATGNSGDYPSNSGRVAPS